MATTLVYTLGDELGDAEIDWADSDGTVIDFSSGYTFSLKVGTKGSAALFTKTSGISGAATFPNITVAWATTGELNSITTPGGYVLQITATRTADSKTRTLQGRLVIEDRVT